MEERHYKIQRINESARSSLEIADMLDPTIQSSQSSFSPAPVPARIRDGSLAAASPAPVKAAVAIKPLDYGRLHSQVSYSIAPPREFSIILFSFRYQYQAGENCVRQRLTWDHMEMHLIGIEYKKIESRSVGGKIPTGTQICKTILTALGKDREAIQYFPFHHLCNVKRLRQGLDNYKKDPARFAQSAPPACAALAFLDDADEGEEGEEEDDEEQEWEDNSGDF